MKIQEVWEDFVWWLEYNIASILLVLFLVMLLGCVGWVIDYGIKSVNCQVVGNYHITSQIEEVQLYSGNNDFQLSGNWSIFGGMVDEKDVVFYWTNNNGVLTKQSVGMLNSSFIEDGENKLIIYDSYCNKYPKIYTGEKYEFHVPENSVMQLYEYK